MSLLRFGVSVNKITNIMNIIKRTFCSLQYKTSARDLRIENYSSYNLVSNGLFLNPFSIVGRKMQILGSKFRFCTVFAGKLNFKLLVKLISGHTVHDFWFTSSTLREFSGSSWALKRAQDFDIFVRGKKLFGHRMWLAKTIFTFSLLIVLFGASR